MEIKYLYIEDDAFAEMDISRRSGYCVDRSLLLYMNKNIDAEERIYSKTYLDWERETCIPFLARMGFVPIANFRTTEGDSFGPLNRSVDLVRDEILYRFCYG